MTKFLFLLSCLLATAAHAATHEIKMKSISYDPKAIEIKVGDDLVWENISYTEHSATSYEDEAKASKFDTGLIQPKGKSKKIAFPKAGIFNYHCVVHGKTMTGKITVAK